MSTIIPLPEALLLDEDGRKEQIRARRDMIYWNDKHTHVQLHSEIVKLTRTIKMTNKRWHNCYY